LIIFLISIASYTPIKILPISTLSFSREVPSGPNGPKPEPEKHELQLYIDRKITKKAIFGL
jgi:hypothetical protein